MRHRHINYNLCLLQQTTLHAAQTLNVFMKIASLYLVIYINNKLNKSTFLFSHKSNHSIVFIPNYSNEIK